LQNSVRGKKRMLDGGSHGRAISQNRKPTNAENQTTVSNLAGWTSDGTESAKGTGLQSAI
jgi:hypothetical protein